MEIIYLYGHSTFFFCLFHLEILLFRLSMAINIEATETKNKYLVQKAVSSHFSSLCSMLSIQLIERFKLTLPGPRRLLTRHSIYC